MKIVRGQPDRKAQMKLWEWRRTMFKHDHTNAQFDAEGLLPNEIVETIVSLTPAAITSSTLSGFLRSEWLFWETYGEEFVEYVRSLEIVYTPANTTRNRRYHGEPGSWYNCRGTSSWVSGTLIKLA